MNLSAGPDARDRPSDIEVREALDRILASESFRGSPQLGAFLRYVVEAALSGRAAFLKGYTIGVEALGRDARFNPQVDPIVRVEATRLRRAMERYYAGAGSDDPIVIELQRGSYVPSFSRRRDPIDIPAAASPPIQPNPDVLVAPPTQVSMVPGAASQDTTGGLPRGNGMPTICIGALRVAGTPRPGHIAAGALGDKIRDAFARFNTVNVASERSPDESAVRTAPRADYRLTGGIDYGEINTTLRFQLIDAAEGTIAWSHTYEYPAAAADPGAAEDEVVSALADTLLQSFGVIRARDRAKHLAAPGGDPRYRCVLAAADSFRSPDRVAHEQARACLEELTASDPSFAVGFEFLAIVYYREYLFDFPARPGDPPALDRALRMARRSIELAPESARAYQMLLVVQYARGDVAAAFAAGDRAIALNKYNLVTQAEYGGRLIMSGDVARGMAMLRRSSETGGARPSWHRFFVFLGHYLDGDIKAAAFEAEQIIDDDYPLTLVARVVAANLTGNTGQARRTIERLIELQPAWRNDARRLLEKRICKPEIVDRLLHDLAAAGLPGAS